MKLLSNLFCVLATCLCATGVVADDLRFEFKIDSQISGTRPWDGSGSSSATVEGIFEGAGSAILGNDNFLNRFAGNTIDNALSSPAEVALDETQATIAPPDPYLCVVGAGAGLGNVSGALAGQNGAGSDFTVTCTVRADVKPNRTSFNIDLPENLASLEIFGVALVDSDFTGADSRVQNGRDELIGFGLYINPELFEALQDGDGAIQAEAKRLIARYERALPGVVDDLFGLSRVASLVTGADQSHALEMEKLSAESCKQSCNFGDATLTIKTTVGGW